MVTAYVVLPRKMLQCDRIDVLVEYESEGNDEAEDVQTLCAHAVWEDLHGIHHDKW